MCLLLDLPVPVIARSKVCVYVGSLAGVAGSNSSEAWIFVSCVCCVLSDRCLCDRPITHPEDSYRMCVSVCNGGTSY